MSVQTGENQQALRKILDMTRLISITILALHFYYYCYAAFLEWELTADLTDRLMGNIKATGIFSTFHKSKAIALGFLAISLMGAKGRKDEKLSYKTAFAYIITGLLIYFFSYLSLLVKIKITHLALLYMGLASTGFYWYLAEVLCYQELLSASSITRTFSTRKTKPSPRKNAS